MVGTRFLGVAADHVCLCLSGGRHHAKRVKKAVRIKVGAGIVLTETSPLQVPKTTHPTLLAIWNWRPVATRATSGRASDSFTRRRQQLLPTTASCQRRWASGRLSGGSECQLVSLASVHIPRASRVTNRQPASDFPLSEPGSVSVSDEPRCPSRAVLEL